MKDRILNLMQNVKEEVGIHEFGIIRTEEIVFHKEVRDICEGNGCGRYGKTWACPPGVGTMEECVELCHQYNYALIFTTFYEIEDSFDFEGMMDAKDLHDAKSRKLRKYLTEEGLEFFMLSSEGCSSCEECTYPESECRYPEIMSPSVESFCIMVKEEADSAGIKYMNGPNTVTYFGNIFFDRK